MYDYMFTPINNPKATINLSILLLGTMSPKPIVVSDVIEK